MTRLSEHVGWSSVWSQDSDTLTPSPAGPSFPAGPSGPVKPWRESRPVYHFTLCKSSISSMSQWNLLDSGHSLTRRRVCVVILDWLSNLHPHPEVLASLVFLVLPIFLLSLWDPTQRQDNQPEKVYWGKYRRVCHSSRLDLLEYLLISPAVQQVRLCPVYKMNKLLHFNTNTSISFISRVCCVHKKLFNICLPDSLRDFQWVHTDFFLVFRIQCLASVAFREEQTRLKWPAADWSHDRSLSLVWTGGAEGAGRRCEVKL